MASRYQTTVYSEKSRKIVIKIKDSAFSGATTNFDTVSASIQYDSESSQGMERFTPIIGSRCTLSLIINTQGLQTLLDDIGNAVEGRFTLEINGYEDDNSTINFNWYGYIVTDLVEFEDVPVGLGFIAQINAIDGLGWLKTLLYKSQVGPYLGQDTVVQHILNCLNQLDFVQSELVANDLPVLHTVFNWHDDIVTYSADNDYALLSVIQHRNFYHLDTKQNYTYQTCYDVLKKICETFGARLIFSTNAYWFIQINEYYNSPASHRYFKYKALGSQVSGTHTLDFTISNLQNNLATSKLMRISGGRWSYYSALKNAVVRYNHNAKRNLMPGVEYRYATPQDPFIVRTGILDHTNAEARLAFTGVLSQKSTWATGTGFEPHIFLYGVKISSITNYMPLMGFSTAQTWGLGSGWSILNPNLIASAATGVAEWQGDAVVANRYYFIYIRVDFAAAGAGSTLRLRMGGVTKNITESGDYEYKIYTSNTDSFKLDSTSTPKFSGTITSLEVKKESKYLKREVTFGNDFAYTFGPASWENSFYEFEFVTDVITLDGTEIVNKVIAFETLAIPETAEYTFEVRLIAMRNEQGTDIKADYTVEYYLVNNYLEFLPDGTVGGQSDIKEFGSDNDDKSSVVYNLDTYIGDGPSQTSNGALRVLDSSGIYMPSDSWKVGNSGTAKNISQLLVNEVIKGQLSPRIRMIDMPFQNLSVDTPYLPHKVIDYSSGYYVFERGTYDLNTDIWRGDWFKIEY